MNPKLMPLAEGWYALYVRPRAERVVAQLLEEKGYEAFLPTYASRHRWSDRVKVVHQPLFPTYLFCRITAESVGRIVGTPGVIRFVGAAGTPIPIDAAEIDALKLLVASRVQAEPWPYSSIGQRVRITTGPLAGLDGLLTRVSTRDRLVVSVSLLQRSVAVVIDHSWVTALSPTLAPLSGVIGATGPDRIAPSV